MQINTQNSLKNIHLLLNFLHVTERVSCLKLGLFISGIVVVGEGGMREGWLEGRVVLGESGVREGCIVGEGGWREGCIVWKGVYCIVGEGGMIEGRVVLMFCLTYNFLHKKICLFFRLIV